MPSNTAASMFGGAGGRGSRVSVASLQGLRNVLRNETDRDSGRAAPASPAASPAAQAAPATPDDKQTLRGLNDRLSGYLGRVGQLEKENGDLEKQINEILAKRKTPKGRDWDEVEKPLDELKTKIKDITMDNANLLLQIDNTGLANNDFKNKLNDEKKAREELEKDLEDLKKTIEDTNLNRIQTQKEIDLVKEELDRLQKEHKEEVDVLREKIKESEVKVELEAQSSNLAEVVYNIRMQYDNLAKKNLKDTEEWYQSKFDNIKVAEAQNNKDFHAGKSELKQLLKDKQSLEIRIHSSQIKIHNLEQALKSTKAEYGQRLGPLNQAIHEMEAELKEVRAQLERHLENNKNLLCVKMKLEAEMDNYQRLMHGITGEPESSEFSLEEALQDDLQNDDKAPEQLEVVKEEDAVEQEVSPSDQSAPPKISPSNQSTPPEAPEAETTAVEAGGDQEKKDVKNTVTDAEAPIKPSKKKSKKKSSSSSSFSSSSSSDDEEEPKKVSEEA